MTRGREFYKRKAGRRDANHAAIRDGLRKLGHFVVDLGAVGDGCPDLEVFPRESAGRALADIVLFGMVTDLKPAFLEVKVGKGKLNAAQVAWHARAEARGIRVAVVRTLDEALEVLR